jgi:Uncharacterized protein conserved in bacteria
MKTKISLLFLAFVLISTGDFFASDYPSGSILWKVSGKDLKKPSYLLGTLHLETGDYLNKISGALDVFAETEQVVGELDMTDMMKVQQQLMPGMMMPTDTTYKMLYSDEDYLYVSEQLTSFVGVGLDHMGILKPSALQTTIVAMIYQKLLPDFDGSNSIDMVVQYMAVEAGKPVLELETVNDQIAALFDASPLQRQADLLLCMLRESNDSDKLVQDALKLIEDYHKGDLNTLYYDGFNKKEDDAVCQPTQEEKDKVLKCRNDKWMKKLPELMKDKSSFIAVGALHLAGEEGLLHQLMQMGYIVEAIR